MISNTFLNFNVPPPSMTCETIETNVDEKICLFVKRHNLTTDFPKNNAIRQKMNLFRVNESFTNLDKSRSDLQNLYADLKTNVDSLSEEEWQAKVNLIHELQQKISSESKFLQENSSDIKRIIEKRQNKRKSRKNRKIRLREKLSQVLASGETKNQEIDCKLREIQEKRYAKKRKIIEKEETCITFASVSKRIREAKQKVELFDSLVKLRQIRKQQAQRPEMDMNEDTFLDEISKMRSLWILALNEYEKERDKLEEYLNDKFKSQQQSIEQQWNETLFGPTSYSKKLDHPLLRAEKNLNAFLGVRQEWDACVVPSTDPSGSSIPLFWVLPEKESNSTWHLYLKK